jgi:hypothetical protein
MRRSAFALVVAVLAGCGSTHRSKPLAEAPPPPQFGSGSDQERGQALANAAFRQRLKERSMTCSACLFAPLPERKGERFDLRSEAVSWTPTHLLVQFVGSLFHPNPEANKNVEVRVLIALKPHNALTVSALSEHRIGKPGLGEQRTLLPRS